MTTAGNGTVGHESLVEGAGRHRVGNWLSPGDQPRWARPALLAVALVSAVLYAWRAGTYLEGYYAAAVRSMSMSWHNFAFAAFDPAGTVTLDKLPGSFWVQALSVRVFGLHTWAIVLPQVVEGVLSVLVLYRIVRRLCGPAAAILASAVLALSPALVALNRGNISDTLMVLLLLLAADRVVMAVKEGRWSSALFAGFWVGLAFQAKMIEAWLVLPALGLVILIAAPGTWRRRLARTAAMGAVAAVVSLGWMTVVTLTPASSRPYVDGSQNNSIYHQVFVYNGVGRIDQESPNQLLTQSIGIPIPPPPAAAWNRLLTGAFGRDTGWLLPAALISLVGGLVATRGEPRRNTIRASFVLWGAWLLALGFTFSFSSSINSYYTAALSPPVAGLVASGSLLAWRRRRWAWVRLLVGLTMVISVAYAAWLLPGTGTGLPGWLFPTLLVLAGLAAVLLVLPSLLDSSAGLLAIGLALSLAAVMIVPGVASVSIAASRLGPFDTPFQPVGVTDGVRAFFGVTSATAALIPRLEQARAGAPYLMATQTSALAAPFIFVSGQEVLPIGGFTGTIPEPSLSTIKSMIRDGRFHLVLQSPTTTDPRFVWIAHHCARVAQPTGTDVPSGGRYAIFYCLPSS